MKIYAPLVPMVVLNNSLSISQRVKEEVQHRGAFRGHCLQHFVGQHSSQHCIDCRHFIDALSKLLHQGRQDLELGWGLVGSLQCAELLLQLRQVCGLQLAPDLLLNIFASCKTGGKPESGCVVGCQANIRCRTIKG